MHHMPRNIEDGSIPGAEFVHIVQLMPCIRVESAVITRLLVNL